MAASGVGRWGGWAAVSASTWRRVGLLLGPVILQLLLFKAIELQVVTDSTLGHVDVADTSAMGTLVARHALPPLVLLLVALLVVLRWQARRPLGLRARIALFLAAWVGLMLVMAVVLPVPPAWLSWTFLAVVRDDLVVLLAGAGVFLVLVERTRGSVRAATLGALHVVTLALMLLASLEFGYFALTGSLADAFMLRYSLANARDASYALGHEAGGSNLVFLLLPVALTVIPLWIERRAARRDEPPAVAPGSAYMLVAAALLLVLVPGRTTSGAAVQLGGSTYLGLVGDLLREPIWESSEAKDEGTATGPLFDTRRLRFVAGERTQPRNVVVVVLESHRVLPDALRARVTPFLDGLAKQSLVVDEMHAIVPHTNRALVPILCGIPPRISQGHAADVPGTCLPALLRPHGYASAFFTPATLAFESKGDLLASMGYDTVRGAEVCEGRGFARVNYFGFEDRAMLAPSLAWVDATRAQAKPFLLTYLTLTSHHPYQLPESVALRPLARNQSFNRYLNTLAYADAFVAELVAGFDARGLMDSTLFVVLGDHGEAFGEHGMRFHSHVVWNEGLRVPTLLHNPRLLPGGARATGPRDQTDILPTIADLLGLGVQDGTLPGVSLLRPVPEDRTLHHATWVENQSMALRRGSRKYVYHYRRRPMEVYDLARDPEERTDRVAEIPDAERRAVELELLRWRQHVNALYRPATGGTDG